MRIVHANDRAEDAALANQRPLLAIDTSSAQAAIALYDGHSLSTRSWSADRSHSTTLLAEIHHILDVATLEVADLGAIAIAIGPGAFTGLRVGFGVAKGFHLATDAPLIGISTLETTAYSFAWSQMPTVAVIAAGRGRIVWAYFAPVTGGVAQTRPPRNGTVDELIAELADGPPSLVVGELDHSQEAALAAVDHIVLPPRLVRIRHPAALADLAWKRWQRGEIDNAATIEPVYLSR